jgi:hypothetical protein
MTKWKTSGRGEFGGCRTNDHLPRGRQCPPVPLCRINAHTAHLPGIARRFRRITPDERPWHRQSLDPVVADGEECVPLSRQVSVLSCAGPGTGAAVFTAGRRAIDGAKSFFGQMLRDFTSEAADHRFRGAIRP